MKVVILAGGHGTRISEETGKVPKPLVLINGKPIIWHIMKIYSHYGYNDFIICCGYKGYVLKEYFNNYYMHNADMTINLQDNSTYYHTTTSEKWKVTLVDTGEMSFTGSRVKQIEKFIEDDEFMLTYGDGVADININELIKYHQSHDSIATITSVQSTGRFGSLQIIGDCVLSFQEKPKQESWINAGFMVFNREVFSILDEEMLEKNTFPQLVKNGQMKAYKHTSFWQAMDTLRDKLYLEKLWNDGKAKWKVW